MPLQPAYTWTETDNNITITVDGIPIKDAGQLFCSDRVVKLNVPPYLLLLDLKHEVDDDRSRAIITKGRKVVLHLTKSQHGLWGKLTAVGDAAVTIQQREESVQRAHQKLLAASQQKQARKQQEERAAIDLQIKQQKAQRDQLEALKEAELQQERQQLHEWQQQLPQPADGQQEQQWFGQGDESDYEDDTAGAELIDTAATQNCVQDDTYCGKGWWPSTAASDNRPADADADNNSAGTGECRQAAIGESTSGSCESLPSGKHNTLHPLDSVAAGQAAGAYRELLLDSAVDSTVVQEALLTENSSRRLQEHKAPAAQPHKLASSSSSGDGGGHSIQPSKAMAPVRSRAAPVQVAFTQLETPHLPAREQRELDIKQIKRASASKADSMDIADRQPAFLKDKGDAFAAQGNYRGAINAYSKALELDPQQAALWANRAAAHLALGQAAECVQDCDAAIGLVQQTLTRLQEAPGVTTERELQAGMLGGAAEPGENAAMLPQAAANEPTAVQPLPEVLGGSDADRTAHMQAAFGSDAESSTGGSASETRSLDQAGAACGMDQNAGPPVTEVQADVADSSGIAEAGQQQQQPQQPTGSSMATKLRRLLVKLLARRAAARVELQQLQKAHQDLQEALALDPNNQGLQADALELTLALQPSSSSDPAAMKELAAARFKAGDKHGAAEAYTALIALLQHQHQHQHADQRHSAQQGDAEAADVCQLSQQQLQPLDPWKQQLAGALSNRAACWLALSKYDECVEDCWTAFTALWPADYILQTQAGNNAVGRLGDSTTPVNVPEAMASYRGSSTTHCHSSSDGGSSSSKGHDHHQQRVTSQLHEWPPELLLEVTSKAIGRTAALAVTRMAAAYSCMKAPQAANAAYAWAGGCWRLLGEHSRVASIEADQKQWQQQHNPLSNSHHPV